MKHLVESDKEKLGRRIKELRKTLGLTHDQLAQASGVSKGTIITIEAGKKGYIFDNAATLAHFFGMELSALTDYDMPLPEEQELRDQITEYHISHHSDKYTFIENIPTLSFTLKSRVLRSDFLDTPREVKHIQAYCKAEYDLDFSSSAITNALNRLVEENRVKIVSKKEAKRFLYKKITQK